MLCKYKSPKKQEKKKKIESAIQKNNFILKMLNISFVGYYKEKKLSILLKKYILLNKYKQKRKKELTSQDNKLFTKYKVA